MHRIGRDSLSILDVRTYGVTQDDILIFTFGEIDVRCHIKKQSELQQRSTSEIIETLAINYLKTILQNKALYPKITCIVSSVLLPRTPIFNPLYPFMESLLKEPSSQSFLNHQLKTLCQASNILFLDFYPHYANSDGTLNPLLSDGTVHIHPDFDLPIRASLFALLSKNKLYDTFMHLFLTPWRNVKFLVFFSLLFTTLTAEVYDCFPFFNELELLQLRLEELSPVVDRFVLVESPHLVFGQSKTSLLRREQTPLFTFSRQNHSHRN